MAKLLLGRTGYEFGTGPVEKEIRKWEKTLHRLDSKRGRQTSETIETKRLVKEKLESLYAWRLEIVANTRPWELERIQDKDVEAVFYSDRDKATKRKAKLQKDAYHGCGRNQAPAAIGGEFIEPNGPPCPRKSDRVVSMSRDNIVIPYTDGMRQRDPKLRKFKRTDRGGQDRTGRKYFRTRY